MDNNSKITIEEDLGTETFTKKYSIVGKNPKIEKIANLMSEVLNIVNPKAQNEICKKTPIRFAEALVEFTSSYDENIDEKITKAIFESENFDDIIIVKDIIFTSLCEHHMLPFFGTANIAYIPKGKILGLSKFPRLVQFLSKRMQLQERLTKEIADHVHRYLEPAGVIVTLEASHSCMCFRGVKSYDSKTQTCYTLGVMKEQQNMNKFFSLLNHTNKNN